MFFKVLTYKEERTQNNLIMIQKNTISRVSSLSVIITKLRNHD